MSFDETHYVPVLKLKSGEKEALPLLSQSIRSRITPLFEVVERNKEKKSSAEHIDTAFKKFKPAVENLRRYFLDCREIALDGPEIVEEVFGRAMDLGAAFVPVTGITRLVDVQAALANRTSGLALRLTRDEYEKGDIQSELLPFIKSHGVPREVIDLIIDLGAVDDMVLPGVQALATAFLNDIPDPTSWRTLTMSASAFPPGMGGLERQSHDLVDRLDWLSWRDGVRADSSLSRIPTFSDGVIQHPRGVENIDWRIMTPAPSVRYTTGDHWLRIKGVSEEIKPRTNQFQELATSLVYGYLSKHFMSASHCSGCQGIWCAAEGADNFGNHTVWRRLGTIHHITHVMEQIDALAAP